MSGLMDLLAKDSGAGLAEKDVGTLSAEQGPEGTTDGPSPEFVSSAESAMDCITTGDREGFADALFACMDLMK